MQPVVMPSEFSMDGNSTLFQFSIPTVMLTLIPEFVEHPFSIENQRCVYPQDRMWRKNRKPVGSNCFGVDLNRNFGYQWNTGGSSPSPCSDTFHGGAPMSENEAKAMQQYMTSKAWTTYVTFHSYGQ